MERLQKVIASYGYTSRRKAEELIRKGKVMVNGKIITELGTKVEANDVISIDSVIINKDVKQEYYLLNKHHNNLLIYINFHNITMMTNFHVIVRKHYSSSNY